MSLPVGSLYAELSLKTAAFEQGLLSARGLFSGFGSFLGSAGLMMGAAVAVVGVAAGKMAMDFQKSMELIRTQAGATQQEVDTMSQAILKLAPQVGQSPEALAAALYHVESAGLRGSKALDVLTIAAQGAKVGNADLESVTNALVAAIGSGIGGFDNMGQAMGVLNSIVGAGNMRMGDLAAAMGTGILSIAKGFGISLESVGGAMATLTRQGIPAQDAAMRLRMSIQMLAAPSAKAQKILAEFGISSTDMATAMAGPQGLLGAIELLKGKMDASGMSTQQQAIAISQAFGPRSGSVIMGLTGNLDLYKATQDQVNSGVTSFQDAWIATESTASAKLDKFIAGVEALLTKIGMGLLPLISSLFDALGSGVQGLSDLWDSFFGTSGSGATGVDGFLGGPMKSLQDGVTNVINMITPVFQAGIAGWQQIFTDLGTGIQGFVNNIMPSLDAAFSWFSTNVLPLINTGLDWLSHTVIPFLANVIGGFVKDVLPKIADGLSWLLTNVLMPLGSFILDTLVNVVFPAFQAALDFIGKNVIPPLQAAVQWFADNVLPALAAAWNDLTTNVLPAVQAALQGLMDKVLIPLWNNVLQPLAAFLVSTFGAAWSFITDKVLPPLLTAFQGLMDNVLSPLWNNVLQPLAAFLVTTFGDAWNFITNKVLPPLRDALGWLKDNVLMPLWNNVLQPLANFIGGAFSVAMDVLRDPVLKLLTGAFDLLKQAVQFVLDVLGAAWAFITGVFDGMLAVLAAAIDGVSTAWDKGKQKAFDWVDQIHKGKQPTLDLINVVLGGPAAWLTFGSAVIATGDIVHGQATGMSQIVSGMAMAMQGNFSGIQTMLISGKGDFSDWFRSIAGTVNQAITAFQTMEAQIRSAFDNVVSVAQTVMRILQGIFASIEGTISGAVSAVSGKLHSMFDPLVAGLNDALANVRAAWNAFARFWNGLTITIPSIDLGPTLGKIGGGTMGLPNLPYFVRGGYMPTSGLAMIGERGPEIVSLPGGAHIFNAAQSRAMTNAGDHRDAPFIGQQNVYGLSPEEVTRQTQRAMRRIALEWSLGHTAPVPTL